MIIYIAGSLDWNYLYYNSVFLDNLSSEGYTIGFSGYGWSITNNLTIGSTSATIDERTIRKKMHIDEFKVEKISATNGSFG